jgi:hypothetical protein
LMMFGLRIKTCERKQALFFDRVDRITSPEWTNHPKA